MRRFKRPNAATIIAFVALFAALGGSAFAAATITSSSIKNGTIKMADMSKSAKKGLKGQRGPRGFTGPQGALGPQGPQGPAGATGITSVVASQADGVGTAFALCPSGMRPVSGGGMEMGTGYLWTSGAGVDDSGRSGWIVAGDAASPVTAFAYCSSSVTSITLPNGRVGAASAKMLSVSKVKSLARQRAAD